MNLNKIIQQHLIWRNHIEDLFHDSTVTTINPFIAVKSDQCEFGQWLLTEEAQKCLSSVDYNTILDAHQVFHFLSGKIVYNFYHVTKKQDDRLMKEFYDMSDSLIHYMKNISFKNY